MKQKLYGKYSQTCVTFLKHIQNYKAKVTFWSKISSSENIDYMIFTSLDSLGFNEQAHINIKKCDIF